MKRINWLAWRMIGALLLVNCNQSNSQQMLEYESDQPGIVIASVYPSEQNNFRAIKYGLTREDFRAIVENFDFARKAIALRGQISNAALGDNRLNSLVIGCSSSSFLDADRYTIQKGRFLTSRELKHAETVCVIDSVTAKHFFGNDNPIGKDLKIVSDYFIVVGILGPDRPAGSTAEIFVPLNTMKLRWGDLNYIRNAGSFTAKHHELSEIRIPTIPTRTKIKQLQSFLKQRHESKDDFRVLGR